MNGSLLPEEDGGDKVRIQKEIDRATTHVLETVSGGTDQDTKNPTERGALTSWKWHREGYVRAQKESDRARGTHILETHREGQVKTQKESDRARGTHELETESGGTNQDMERIPPSEGHSLSGDDVERDRSEHIKNPTGQGALTNWRRHREGQVRKRKESDRARDTHILETPSGEIS